MKKLVKLFIIFVLICIIIYSVITSRKMIIIRDLSIKNDYYKDVDNYYQKCIRTTEKATITSELYALGKKSVIFINVKINQTGENIKRIMYCDENGSTLYNQIGKADILNEYDILLTIRPFNLEFENCSLYELFNASKIFSIKSGKFDGKECYIINYKNYADLKDIYVDKENALAIKMGECEYYYEFNNVNDDIFILSDLSEYEIQED